MKRIVRCFAFCTLIIVLALPFTKTKAAFPYKYTISGPGLDRTAVEVWMAADEHMLRVMQSGLISDLAGRSPGSSEAVYQIEWWWGRCWLNPTPCMTDPGDAWGMRTLYYFDHVSRQGYLFYVDKPGYLSRGVTDQWIAMPEGFDEAVQQVIAVHTRFF